MRNELKCMIFIELNQLCRSARSLAGSATPPSLTYMRAARSGPSAMELNEDSSSEDEASSPPFKISGTQPRPISRSVSVSLSLVYLKLYNDGIC